MNRKQNIKRERGRCVDVKEEETKQQAIETEPNRKENRERTKKPRTKKRERLKTQNELPGKKNET